MARRRGWGEGSIYQRKDGRWSGTVELGLINGKRKRKQVYGKSRKAVADKIRELRGQQQQGLTIPSSKLTVAQFLEDQWLPQVVKSNRSPSTYNSYSDMVRLHIVPHIGNHELIKLTPAHVQAMLNELSKTLSARTVQYIRSSVLSGALRVAMKWGYISRNVAALTESPRVRKYVAKPLTLAQAKALLEAVKGHRMEALYLVALTLGLRKGEVLGLRWEDIDLEHHTLRIAVALQRLGRKGSKPELRSPKTETSRRTLPLPDVLIQVLREHRERQDKERQQDKWQEHGLVFPSEVGTPKEPRNLITHFKSMLKKAGLPSTIRFHDLRHSFATMLVAQGVHPRVAMELMGHSSIEETMNIYASVLSENSRDATDRISSLFAEEDEKSGK